MSTVGAPGPMIMPDGPGIGPTQAAWTVGSVSRAAGMLPIKTVGEPGMIIPGPPGTQPGSMQGWLMSVARAAGILPMRTVGRPLMMARGIGGCGKGVGVGAGGCMGA